MNTTERAVADAIRKLRIQTGETQEVFAKAVGVSVSTLAKYETLVQRPKPSVAARLVLEAQTRGLPDLAVLFQKALRERGEKAHRVRALRTESIFRRLVALKQSTEQLTKESDRLRKTVTLHNGKVPDDHDSARILEAARLTIDAQTKTIENLRIIVENYAEPVE
jgi:transcriptional regulator with XRE-family HTH domain